MSDKLKIKLSIADRVYPLSVDAEQEESLRQAAAQLQKMVKQFEANYAVNDKQDVLAMCALQLANTVNLKNRDQHNYQSSVSQLKALSNAIDNALTGVAE
jgi:cell division protein ZapA